MNRWRLWQWWLPRVMLAVVLLLAVQLVLGRLTRSTVIELGGSAVGARVDVAHARISLAGRRIMLRDVQVADPQRPLQNLVEADRCEFELAARPLFQKRVVVDRGTISGLRFATPRRESGDGEKRKEAVSAARPSVTAYDPQNCSRSITRPLFQTEANHKAIEWLDHLNRQFDPKLIDGCEQLQRTAEAVERMRANATAIERRVDQLAQRARQLQANLNSALANPLRHAEFLQTVAVEIPKLQQEFAAARAELERLPSAIEMDRRAIVASRRHDEAWLREQLRATPADADALTAYLLEQQLTPRLQELMAWLRLARQIVPEKAAPPAPAGRRGEDILFAGSERVPGLLVRELTLDGSTRIAGRVVDFRGTLTDFASMPALHDRPLRVKLAAMDSPRIVLQSTIDRTGAVARDEFLIDCQPVLLPQAELGDAERLRLVLAPSVGALSVSVKLEGEQLSGDLQLVQNQVVITSVLGAELGNVPLARALNETLGDVTSVATRVSLSGTLTEPDCRLWSNLGPAVAEAMVGALAKAAEQHTHRMLSHAQRQVDERLTDLERKMADAEKRLRPKLARATGQLDEIAAAQKPPQRITTEHVGRRLPANSLFR